MTYIYESAARLRTEANKLEQAAEALREEAARLVTENLSLETTKNLTKGEKT